MANAKPNHRAVFRFQRTRLLVAAVQQAQWRCQLASDRACLISKSSCSSMPAGEQPVDHETDATAAGAPAEEGDAMVERGSE